METSQLLAKIKDLESQRNKHERIIQKLLDQTPSTTRSYRIDHLPLTNNRQQFNNNNNVTDSATNRSNVSLTCQVNLDTYLTGHTKNTDKNMHQSVNSSSCDKTASNKQLWASLAQLFPYKNIQIAPVMSHPLAFSLVSSQKFVDFALIADYLTRNDLWDEIFITESNSTQFYACVYPQFCAVEPGQYVCLSNFKLQQQEHTLIIQNIQQNQANRKQKEQQDEYENDSQMSSSKHKSSKGSQSICIGYLLLYRLMSRLGSGHAPQILQQLFGYPYQQYSIQQTKSYLSLLQNTKQHQPSCPILLFGQLSLNNNLQRVPIQSLIKLSPSKLISKYSRITVIRQMESICSKELAVMHRRNHHAVIDIDTSQLLQASICWLSFINIKDKHGNIQEKENKGIFGFCLMAQDGDIIKYSQPYQNERSAVRLNLMPNTEYKLYVSYRPDKMDQALSQFKIVLQSSAPVNNIELSLKLNESYNTMTETIINRYLTSSPHLDEIQKQFISLSHTKPKSDLLVVRANLQLMGLAVDFISVQEHARRKARQIQICYQEQETLCDQDYKKNKKIIKSTLPQIYQIYLSKRVPISEIKGLSFSFTQLNL